jgi:hypothetical protein
MIITTATATEVSCTNCSFKLGIRSSRTYHRIIEYTGTVVMMTLIIFIRGFYLRDHTEWGRPNMVFKTPAHGADHPLSLSQSRHRICIKCGVSASGSMGLARGMPVHVQFSYLPDVCDVTSISKTVLTKKCSKQSGRGFLGVAPACFLTHPLSAYQTRFTKLYVPVVFLNLTHWSHKLPPSLPVLRLLKVS